MADFHDAHAERVGEGAGGSLLELLGQLADALADLECPQGTQPPQPDSMVGEVLRVARRTVHAAGPLLAAQDVLKGLVQDALEYREPQTDWCGDCARTRENAPCEDHANDTALTEAYAALGRALVGTRYCNA